MKMTPTLTALALAAGLTLVGCSDLAIPTEPLGDPGETQPFFSRSPEPGFGVLRRADPLLSDVSRSKVIGPGGGTIVIPSVDADRSRDQELETVWSEPEGHRIARQRGHRDLRVVGQSERRYDERYADGRDDDGSAARSDDLRA